MNQCDIYETGKDQRKSRFGWGIKNSVLYIVIVNSMVLEQDKRMCPILGKGFVLVLTVTSCSQIPSTSHHQGIFCFPSSASGSKLQIRKGVAGLCRPGWTALRD